jgi:hypothetical protein
MQQDDVEKANLEEEQVPIDEKPTLDRSSSHTVCVKINNEL